MVRAFRCSQTPERSGFPSAVFGAGAVRLGLPSGVRGRPGVGKLSHWAPKGTHNPDTASAMAIFVTINPKTAYTVRLCQVAPFVNEEIGRGPNAGEGARPTNAGHMACLYTRGAALSVRVII